MVRARSRMKQDEMAAHSSGANGGDSRVFDLPGIGVLQMMATAMGFIGSNSHGESAGQIEMQFIDVLETDRETQQVGGTGRAFAFDRGTMLDQAFYAAERGGSLPQPDAGGGGNRRLLAFGDAQRQHAAEAARHLPHGNVVAGMRAQAGIEN